MNRDTMAYLKSRKLRQKDALRQNKNLYLDLPKGLLVFTFILITAQVLLSNIFGVKGAELVQLSERKEALQHEKIVLENELAKLSSLSRVETECKTKLAMDKNLNNIEYLSPDIVASR